MRTNEQLRREVKLLKATDAIKSYKELVELMEDIHYKSFTNWLSNAYDLGIEKRQRLDSIIDDLSIQE